MLNLKTVAFTALSILMSSAVWAQNTTLKQKLEQQGYNFVKQIDAPEGLEGWSGYKDEYPSTIFLSKDQNYYIVGNLFDANNHNLSEVAINTHVKSVVLDEIWKSLENSTWIQDGKTDAAKIVYVFSDVNCPYCHSFWQQAQPDIQFVLVNQGEDAEQVQGYLAEQQLNLKNVLLDPEGKTALATGMYGLPSTLFYNAAGQLVDSHMGEISQTVLAEKLRKIQD